MAYDDDCTPMWATVEQFVIANPSVQANDDEIEAALIEATWMLDGLLLGDHHGAECRVDTYRNRPGLCVIELDMQPVDEVFSVVKRHTCGIDPEDVDGWCALPGGYVRICNERSPLRYPSRYVSGYGDYGSVMAESIMTTNCCTGCASDTSIEIQYRVQSNIPPGAARATVKLASEFWLSAHGMACALPERITNVNRQGVSWTILDPLDFLEQGLTGIGSIDMWISRVNGRGAAGLIDPLTRPQLLVSEMTGCGPDCTGV